MEGRGLRQKLPRTPCFLIGGRLTECEQVQVHSPRSCPNAVETRNVVIILTGRSNDYSGTFRNDYDSVHSDPTKLRLQNVLHMKHEYWSYRGKF